MAKNQIAGLLMLALLFSSCKGLESFDKKTAESQPATLQNAPSSATDETSVESSAAIVVEFHSLTNPSDSDRSRYDVAVAHLKSRATPFSRYVSESYKKTPEFDFNRKFQLLSLLKTAPSPTLIQELYEWATAPWLSKKATELRSTEASFRLAALQALADFSHAGDPEAQRSIMRLIKTVAPASYRDSENKTLVVSAALRSFKSRREAIQKLRNEFEPAERAILYQ